MDAGEVSEFFKHKSILVTGSTGFIAKLFVEKILRIQPQVKKIYLLIRAPDNASVNDRMQKEVFKKEAFRVLREKHGGEFDSFISNKVTPIAGDVSVQNLGIKDMNLIQEMQKEIHIVVHSAATTRFNERYEVALDINVQGTKNVLEFTRKCPNLQMLVHLSTAYVSSMKENLITEEPFSMKNPLKEHLTLDISQEINMANGRLHELHSKNVDKRTERDAMRELGVERAKLFGWANTYVFTKAMGEMLLIDQKGDIPTVILRPTMVTSTYKDPFPGWIEEAKTIDAVTVSFAKGELKVFPNDPSGIVDVIPADIVCNAMIIIICAETMKPSKLIYHISSSATNPLTYLDYKIFLYEYFSSEPCKREDGSLIKVQNAMIFRTMAGFKFYMKVRYGLFLWALRMINYDSNIFEQRYKYILGLAELYEPFTFFKGRFDDTNLRDLLMMTKSNIDKKFFCDIQQVDWVDYFINIHFPGIVKHVVK